MISQHPISGAPISAAEEAPGSSGSQTYELEINDGLGLSEYIADRNPDTFEDIIEESLGVEDLPSVPSAYNEIIDESLAVEDTHANGNLPVEFTKLPYGDHLVTITLELLEGYSVIINWGDLSSVEIEGPSSESFTHEYVNQSQTYNISIVGDVDQLTGFFISGNGTLVSFEALSQMVSLLNLGFSGSYITGNLTAIENMIGLQGFQLWGVTCSLIGFSANISSLANFPDLRKVVFGGNGAKLSGDVSDLAGLTQLSQLIFADSFVEDLRFTPSLLSWDVNTDNPEGSEADCTLSFDTTRFLESEVDAILNNLDSISESLPLLSRNIYFSGTNGTRSSASSDAVISLREKGWVITFDLEEMVVDSAVFSDYSLWVTGYSKVIIETLRMLDTGKIGFHLQVAESLGVAEQLKEALGILAHDFLNLNPGLFSNWKGSEGVGSGLSISDVSSFGKQFLDSLDENIGLSDFSMFSFHLLILDSITCSSSVEAAGLFQRQIMEAMALTDSALKAWESLIEDVFSVVESASLIYGVMATVEESVSLSGNSAYLLFANEAINDSFQLQPSIALRSVLGAIVQESLGLFGQVLIDGEVWECWVLNTNKFHPSIYSGFDFNSYAIFEGRAYGAKADGIYELSGDTDNGSGVRSGVAFPETDFGTTAGKRFRKAFLGVSGDSTVLKVENENDYGFYSIEKDKTTINRSLYGKKWKLSVLDFENLHFIELFPVILTR